MESRRGSPITQCQLQEELSVTEPNRRIINRKNDQLLALPGKDIHWIFPKKSNTPATHSPMKTIITLNFCFSPMDFHSKQLLPTSFFFCIKSCSSPLLAGFVYGFANSLQIMDFNLLFPNKPTFAGKITDCFIFNRRLQRAES